MERVVAEVGEAVPGKWRTTTLCPEKNLNESRYMIT